MSEDLFVPRETQSWPYADLVLRTSLCPWCGSIPSVVVSPLVHPMAWCHNEACRCLMFDPSKTARENLAGDIQLVDLDVTDEAEPPT